MPGAGLTLALRVRGDAVPGLKEVQSIHGGEIFTGAVPQRWGRMLGLSEKVSLKKSERFLHSHTSGVSHLRELLPILFSPRYACDPPVVLVHREEEGGGHPLHQHHLLHHRHPRAAEPRPLAGNEKAQRLQADTLGSEMGRDTPEAPDGSGQSWVQNPRVLAPPS